MKTRNVLTLLIAFLLLGATACSTSGSAETSDDETTTAQAQALEEEEAEEEMADEDDEDEDDEDDEMAEGDDAEEGEEGDEKAEMKEKMAGMCPMQVEGTTAGVQKMDGMVAMDFTTESGDVEELRERIAAMAERHNKHHARGMKKGMEKGEKKGKKHAAMYKTMKNATAATEEIDKGMRLMLTPDEADQMDTLQEHMQQHAQMMAKGEGCPMMMMKGKKSGHMKKMKEKRGGDMEDEE